MSAEITTLQKDYGEVLHVLARLVHKIEMAEARGTPIHPQGKPDCAWLKDGYPREYRHARRVLKKALAREDEKWEGNQ
jgi:hypothetical protein